MASLYRLTSEFAETLSFLTDPEADEQTVHDTLEAIKGDIEVKADGYASIMRTLVSEQKALEEEKKFIDSAIQLRKNAIKRMNEAIMAAMDVMGVKEIRGEKFTFKVQNNGGAQPLKVDEDKVPDSFKRIIYETDNAKIREVLMDGEFLSWAHLEPRGRHLVIK